MVQGEAHLVVNDLAEPLSISVEYEAVHAYRLVLSDTDLLNQARLVAHCA